MKQGIINDPFFQEFSMLFRSAHDQNAPFQPLISNIKTDYPMDVWVNDEFYTIEIPIVKGKSDDITMTREGDTLRVKYTRSDRNGTGFKYIKRGIISRDFDLVWKIPSKFDCSKISSVFEGGLLSIFIPFAETQKPEVISINDPAKGWKKIAQGETLDS